MKATTTAKTGLEGCWLFACIAAPIILMQLALRWRPIVGAYVTALTLVLFAGVALRREATQKLAISAGIIPVSMMICLSLPQSSAFADSTVLYGSVLVLALIYRYAFMLDQPLKNTKLTYRGYALLLPLMLAIGLVLGIISYLLLRYQYSYGLIRLPLAIAAGVVFAFSEEIFFRGLIQQRAAQVMNPALAAVLSTVLLTAMAIGHTTLLLPAAALICSAMSSFIYYKRQNLVLTMTTNSISKVVYIALWAVFILH